ncbi:hypothetical protein RRG08_020194 [Elysia crispata]|uniref:Uncharacterized protein n=1 Tax=Elysia crispata TaxID=231223 RepID=A0AAE1DR59_9GAST|nr:hypothetical protein RRG08_020194 [Elysia crispata]
MSRHAQRLLRRKTWVYLSVLFRHDSRTMAYILAPVCVWAKYHGTLYASSLTRVLTFTVCELQYDGHLLAWTVVTYLTDAVSGHIAGESRPPGTDSLKQFGADQITKPLELVTR